MLKLYKRSEAELLYWEAWDSGRELVIHEGVVGDTGTSRTVKLRVLEKPQAAIRREAQPFLREGYEEITLDDHTQLVIQYRGEGTAGLGKRSAVESVLNETLGWTGNGHCDGGDIGGGKVNVFALVLDPRLATKSILAALRAERLLKGAVMAVQEGDVLKVVWPSDHEGDFEY
jgi:hypothetical protein